MKRVHFDIGKLIITPQAKEEMDALTLSETYFLRKHQLQNFEPMPDYAFLNADQMYMVDMEKNTEVIECRHGRIFSYVQFDKIKFYIITNIRMGRSEGTIICLADED